MPREKDERLLIGVVRENGDLVVRNTVPLTKDRGYPCMIVSK